MSRHSNIAATIFTFAGLGTLLAVGACSSSDASPSSESDGGGVTVDAGAAADAQVSSQDGDAPRAQACEAGQVATCQSLAAVWSAGNATCAPDGTRWDVKGCTAAAQPNGGRVAETVYPARRDANRWGNAKCSYEGEFVFEVSMASKPSNVWQISLEGGGQCHSDTMDDCGTRDLWKVAPFRNDGGGKFSAYGPDRTITNGALAGEYDTPEITRDANVVMTNYCSSDLWSGTQLAGISVAYKDPRTNTIVKKPWTFTGRYNARSLFEILRERYGLDDSNPNLAVHLRGQSAGGIGAANNAWVLRDLLPKAAAAHRIMISSWHGSSIRDWDPRTIGFDKVDDFWPGGMQGLTGRQAWAAVQSIWKTELMPACAKDHPGPDCLQTPMLYDYIANEPTETPAGMGMPILIYQNRQDLVWTSNFGMKPLTVPPTHDQTLVREAHLALLNDELGLDPQKPSKGRIKWLFAPNDPTMDPPGAGKEETVHPPLDYFLNPPGPKSNSLSELTKRFWAQLGKKDWRAAGEVITFDCNWVVMADHPELRNCKP